MTQPLRETIAVSMVSRENRENPTQTVCGAHETTEPSILRAISLPLRRQWVLFGYAPAWIQSPADLKRMTRTCNLPESILIFTDNNICLISLENPKGKR